MTGGKRFQWNVALILFGVLFLGVSDAQLVPPLLSTIAQEFRITPGLAGIIVTGYSLAAAAFALIAGPLSDRIGRKKVLTGGLILFTTASFATYQVNTFALLVLVRAVTGFAAGTLSTCALSYAGDYYPYLERGRAMGILSMGYFLAFVLGPPAGALMVPRWGWGSVFAVLASLSAAILMLVVWALPQDSPHTDSREARRRILPDTQGYLKRPDRIAGMVAAFLTSGGLVGYVTYIGAWLRDVQQISFDQLAFAFVLSGLAAVAASPLSGWLSDRAGKKAVIIGANLVLAPAFLIVARLEWGAGLWAGMVLLGVAASARQAPLHALTMELVGPEIRGEYTALRNAASQMGIAFSASVSAYAYDTSGFAGASVVASMLTLLVPVSCFWLRDK